MRNAVNLSNNPTSSVTEVAKTNLRIDVQLLYRWRKQQSLKSEIAFQGNDKQSLTEVKKRIK